MVQTSTGNNSTFSSQWEQVKQVVRTVRAGHSVLVLGEYGIGKDEFARTIQGELQELSIGTAIYTGSVKQFLVTLAESLDIPTTAPKYNKDGEVTGEKAMTVDALKEEISQNVNQNTVLILPEAQRLPASIRYWLDILLKKGVRLVCLAIASLKKDLFLSMIEIEIQAPTNYEIRQIMEDEAGKHDLKLSRSQLASLQTQAGRNPMLARKVIRQEALGIKNRNPEHSQYIVIMPIIIAILMSFGIMRFVGLGTRNRALYVTGGVCLVAAMMLKQVGSIRGASKRLGQ